MNKLSTREMKPLSQVTWQIRGRNLGLCLLSGLGRWGRGGRWGCLAFFVEVSSGVVHLVLNVSYCEAMKNTDGASCYHYEMKCFAHLGCGLFSRAESVRSSCAKFPANLELGSDSQLVVSWLCDSGEPLTRLSSGCLGVRWGQTSVLFLLVAPGTGM